MARTQKKNQSPPVAFFTKTMETGSDALTFVVLLLWYVAAIYLVIFSLSTHQFQRRVTAVPIETASNTAKLRRWDGEFKRLTVNVAAEKTLLGEAQAKSEAARRNLAEIDAKLARRDEELKQAPENAGRRTAYNDAKATQVEASRHWDAERENVTFRKASHELAIKQLNEHNAKLTPRERAELELVRQQDHQQDSIRRWAPFFLEMPKELLTLVLALSMGALGSTVYVTRAYFHQNQDDLDRSRAWYLIRPLHGAILGLIMYFVVKAGVIVFSTSATTTPNGDSDLNPFVIALFATISGIFSERAYRKLDEIAYRYFRTDLPKGGGPARVARDLQKAIETAHRKPSELAGYLGRSMDEVHEWIEGRRPVPGQVQRVIAFWLGKPIDDLFEPTPS